jgi:hypothetical protein
MIFTQVQGMLAIFPLVSLEVVYNANSLVLKITLDQV